MPFLVHGQFFAGNACNAGGHLEEDHRERRGAERLIEGQPDLGGDVIDPCMRLEVLGHAEHNCAEGTLSVVSCVSYAWATMGQRVCLTTVPRDELPRLERLEGHEV